MEISISALHDNCKLHFGIVHLLEVGMTKVDDVLVPSKVQGLGFLCEQPLSRCCRAGDDDGFTDGFYACKSSHRSSHFLHRSSDVWSIAVWWEGNVRVVVIGTGLVRTRETQCRNNKGHTGRMTAAAGPSQERIPNYSCKHLGATVVVGYVSKVSVV